MSCLFISLAPAVKTNSDNLRKLIVDFLKTNPSLIDSIKANDVINWTEKMNLQKYTEKMSHTNTMGGAIEIRAFCELFRSNVIVHSVSNNKKIEFKCSSQPAKIIVHLTYTGNHYSLKYHYVYI